MGTQVAVKLVVNFGWQRGLEYDSRQAPFRRLARDGLKAETKVGQCPIQLSTKLMRYPHDHFTAWQCCVVYKKRSSAQVQSGRYLQVMIISQADGYHTSSPLKHVTYFSVIAHSLTLRDTRSCETEIITIRLGYLEGRYSPK